MEPYLLLIEDEQHIRENVAELLTLNGFKVQTAANGREGVWLATTQRPELILCDVMMPELDGFQTLEIIRSNPTLSTVPFLFLTAKTELTDTRKGMALGADDYLTKPFKLDVLLTAIRGRLKREVQRRTQVQAFLSEQIRAMTNVVSHEYNTPLSGILGFSSLLLNGYDDYGREDAVLMLTMIHISGLRLKRSLDNNQLITRLETLRPEDAAFPFLSTGDTFCDSALIEHVCQSIRYRQDRSVPYRVEVESARIGIATDNLRTILDELLDNACKFSLGDEPVQITGHQADGQYIVTIVNEGQPFTSADIERVEAYRQFERGRYEQQGFGLGLAIAQKLLALNKGSLSIDKLSTTKTQVKVCLPLCNG